MCWSRSVGEQARARSRNPDHANRDSRRQAGRRGTCPCRSQCGRRSTPGNSRTCGARGACRSHSRSTCAGCRAGARTRPRRISFSPRPMNTCICFGSVGLTDSRASIVGRHVAPAEQRQTFTRDHLRIDVANDLPPVCVRRHEQIADRVLAGLRQFESKLGCFLGKELVRNLYENAGAVSHARIRADRTAMLEIAENAQAIFDDLMRFAAFDVRDESDAARILVERRIVETLHDGCARIRGRTASGKSCVALLLAHLVLPRRRSRCSGVLASSARPSCSRSMLTDLEKGSPVRLIAARGCSCRAPPMSAPAT